MTPRVGIGVAGLGCLGRVHAANLANRVSAAELRRVVDIDDSTAREVGSDLDVAWSTDYQELLVDPNIAAVVIATPTAMHADLIERAAEAGKHVFTEKPISLDVDSSLRAVAAARHAGIKLQVGFNRRFDADWIAVAERLHAGELGPVYFFRSTQRDMVPPPDASYIATCGNLFVDAMIHDFDCALWLVGDIVEVSTVAASVTSPIFAEAGDVDHAIVAIRFANGALGVVDASRAAGYGYESSSEIVSENGAARVGHHRRRNVEWLTPGTSTRDHVTAYNERFAASYVSELEGFARSILENSEPRVGGKDAIAALSVASAAAQSHRERGPIAVDNSERPRAAPLKSGPS